MSGKAGGQWTDAENYSMLYQIIQQLTSSGKVAIKFGKIDVPGRTPRALQEHWNKIRSDVNAAGISTQGPAGVPLVRAPRTPSGKKATKGNGTPSAAKRRKLTPKKRKAESSDEDDAMSNVKSTTTDFSDNEVGDEEVGCH